MSRLIGPSVNPSRVLVLACFAQALSNGQLSADMGSVSQLVQVESGVYDPVGIDAVPNFTQASFESVKSATVSDTCPVLTTFNLSSDHIATRIDSSLHVMEIYAGDFGGNQITRTRVDQWLSRTTDSLPLAYGVPMVAEDIDLDGSIELIVQRGDGFNGFMDIVSSLTWSTRQRLAFPGMNVFMSAQTVQLDTDSTPEIYATPSTLGGTTRIVVIDYDPVGDSFLVRANNPAPDGGYGRSAIGDFDSDGLIEFVQGNYSGYGIYEWTGANSVFKGQLWTLPDLGQNVVACRPLPNGALCLLLGYSDEPNGYLYRLLRSNGNDSFQEVAMFRRQTGWHGGSTVSAADVDCDGLDELLLTFYPSYESWQWNPPSLSFENACAWDAQVTGGLYHWHNLDLNHDGRVDWISVNAISRFWSFVGNACDQCDDSGYCATPTRVCSCFCHPDPVCDSIVTDILDVTRVVDVAFRGEPESMDPSLTCPVRPTDVDCSGTTSVVDVVKAVNVAFRGASPADEYCDPCN